MRLGQVHLLKVSDGNVLEHHGTDCLEGGGVQLKLGVSSDVEDDHTLGDGLPLTQGGAHGGARLADAEVTVGGFRDDSAVMLVTPYDEVEEVRKLSGSFQECSWWVLTRDLVEDSIARAPDSAFTKS